MKKDLNRATPGILAGSKPWIKYAAAGAVILLFFAVSLYVFRYISLDREFHHNIKTFGEDTYKEIFSLQDSKDRAEPIMALAEEAFSYVGTEMEASEQFGLLSRYSCTENGAVAEEHSLDYIISSIGENSGYIWVAYTRTALDPGGEAISASGSAKTRILSRWTLGRSEIGTWTVTQICEGP